MGEARIYNFLRDVSVAHDGHSKCVREPVLGNPNMDHTVHN